MNEYDIKAHWQRTSEEPLVMTIEVLHRRSLAFHRAIWRQDAVELMACALVALVFGLQIGAAPNALTRLGEVLGIVSAVIAAYRLRRHAATRPTDASVGASLLGFHVRELQRRRDLMRSVWRWIVVPILIAIWVIVAGFAQARPAGAWPLLAFGGIVTVIGLVLSLANIQKSRGLQRDIDALEALAVRDAQ